MKTVKAFIVRHKKLTVAAVAGTLLLVWFGRGFVQNKTAVPQYQTAEVTRGTVISAISASGQMVATGRMTVSTTATGQVKTVYVKDGDVVSSGQKILELIPDSAGRQKQTAAWSSYLSAKNSLDSATTTLFTLHSDLLLKWKDYMDLAQGDSYENGDGSPKNDARQLPQFISPQDLWLFSESKYKNQQAVIAQSQAGVASAWASYQASSPVVVSPMVGTITDLTYVPGMVIGATTDTSVHIGTIISDAKPAASVTVSEVDVGRVKSGQKVTITVDSFPDKTFTGVVVGLNKTGVVSSGVTTYPVTVQFDTQPEGLLPNMSVTANIILDTKADVLVVPSAAIATQDGASTVRVLRSGREEQVPVEIGLSSDTETEILSGLSIGDEVITGTAVVGTTTTGRSVFGTGGFGGGGAFRLGGGGNVQRR